MLLLLATIHSTELRLRTSRLFGRLGLASSTPTQPPGGSEYLLEFRGSQPLLRLQEFYDALNYCTGERNRWDTYSAAAASPTGQRSSSGSRSVVRDRTSDVPICTYVTIPGGDSVVRQLVQRCSLVRSVVECWADAATADEASRQAYANSLIFNKDGALVRPEDSWRVSFRRYGRGGKSGLDYDEKNQFLSKFADTIAAFRGGVNLTAPTQDFLYLEDNFDYHDKVTIVSAKRGFPKGSQGFSAIEAEYKPLRALFGRVVATSDEYIGELYNVKTRKFIGTTTMDPIVAHCTAVAAMVGPGDLVLDPFVGTGGLLVACASLGALVVGSDIDGGSLMNQRALDSLVAGAGLGRENINVKLLSSGGLGLGSGDTVASRETSKNSNFNRRNSSQSQSDLCVFDNFVDYGLEHSVMGLHELDVRAWGRGAASDVAARYDLFDAIVTDPPYGHREKARQADGSGSGAAGAKVQLNTYTKRSSDDTTDEVYVSLLQVAERRLKVGGRLVFWLPTEPQTSLEDVTALLQQLMVAAGSQAARTLRLRRAAREELNDALWRWLCIYTKDIE